MTIGRPQSRSWMFVVDEKFAETICSMPWRKVARKYLVTGSGGSKSVLMHRLVWQLEYGELPTEIDHINRCPWDNRLCNLRAITRSGNNHNYTRARKKYDLPPGVHIRVNSGTGKPVRERPYESYCVYRGKKHHFGYFSTPEAAAVPYREFKAKIVQKEVIDGKQI